MESRRTADFHPSVWEKSLLLLSNDNSNEQAKILIHEWRKRAEKLKAEVVKLLKGDQYNKRSCLETLRLIDAVQRLGVAYHFEDEIEEEMASIFRSYHGQIHDDEEDLRTAALRFRLLREHRYNVTCDVFKKFMEETGDFKKSCEDVDGLINLYEATFLGMKGETILDEAYNFAVESLKSLLPRSIPCVVKQIQAALYRPVHKRMKRAEARYYLAIYEKDENHSEVLLQFAKLDFNILQKLHQEELRLMSKWWYEDLDYEKNFKFVRDRIVEVYYWALAVYMEPQYTTSRRFLAKMLAMISLVDDIYDAYGTKDELELFTKAINRWEFSTAVDLPNCMKVCCQKLFNIFREAEDEIINQGRSLYGLECAKEEFKRLSRAYMEQIKWLDRQDFPTVEEYNKVGLDLSAYTLLAVASLVMRDDGAANEEAIEWLLTRPKIVIATSIICRIMNDIVSYKFEQVRGGPPTAIECYTEQYNVTEEEACDVHRKIVEDGWKDINKTFLNPTPVATSVLMAVLNFTRGVELYYKESDHYTHVTPQLEENITASLFNSLQIQD